MAWITNKSTEKFCKQNREVKIASTMLWDMITYSSVDGYQTVRRHTLRKIVMAILS
jgi:tryptophan synthase alpha subunit